MENRYKLPILIQKTYFQQIEEVSRQSSHQLAQVFGVVGRTYRDWRRGKFALPEHVVEKIEQLYGIPFPYSKESAIKLWFDTKHSAARIGGIARFKKYGRLSTTEGCKKGGRKALEILRVRGVVPVAKPFFPPEKTSDELAEFIGILLGDGHIGKIQWSITINATADRDYLSYITNLVQSLFTFSPSVMHRVDYNVNVIYGGGKGSIAYFQSLGLSVGNKVLQQVGIPDWIKRVPTFRIACLRGLMDTDGGIFIHKYKVNNKKYQYKKLCFVNCSLPILYFVYDTLHMVGLHPKVMMKQSSKRVWLYNQNEVQEYLGIVGTHNQRLLKYEQNLLGGVR